MKNWDKKELLSFLGVIVFALIGLFLFWGRQGDIATDTGREFYIPEQMLNGQVLYKDIFNIYGALAYQINMLLYNFFGTNTLTLHVFGNIVGFGIISIIYLVSRQFLDKFYSGLICVFSALIGIYKMYIFNYVVPYSFAVTYGMFCALLALYFLILYLKRDDKKSFYISAFFAGTAFAFKYDFALFLLIYPIVCHLQKESLKTFMKLILVGLIMPFISFGIVFVSGLNFNDFLYNVELFRRISQVPSLTYFYQHHGVFLSKSLLFAICRNISILVGYSICWWLINNKNCISSHSILSSRLIKAINFVLFTSFILFIYSTGFNFIGLVVVALCLIKFSKISLNKVDFVILLSLILLSIKSLFVCKLGFYGIYSFPFLLMALSLVLHRYYFEGVKYLKLFFCIACIVLLFDAVKSEFIIRGLYGSKIQTEKGWISSASDRTASALLVKYILNKTEKDDRIVILPEGHMVNFLTDRKSDDYYGNLIPMYVEAFGEDSIISHYEKNMPEYFILTDRNMSEYGKMHICSDYAQNLCRWIFKNYHVVYKILGAPEYTILRKNR